MPPMTQALEIPCLSGESDQALGERIETALVRMNEIYAGGHYPRVTVVRSWSSHNPAISGEVARPSCARW